MVQKAVAGVLNGEAAASSIEFAFAPTRLVVQIQYFAFATQCLQVLPYLF